MTKDRAIRLFERNGNFWASYTYEAYISRTIETRNVDTGFKAIQSYRKKALRRAKQLINQLLLKKGCAPKTNSILSISSDCHRSQSEICMNLIKIRSNYIHYHFRYTHPKTQKREWYRRASGLVDTPENRLKAAQEAQQLYNECCNLEGEHQDSSSRRDAKRKIKAKDIVTVQDLIDYYKTRPEYNERTKQSKIIYNRYIDLYIIPHFGKEELEELDGDIIEDLGIYLSQKEKKSNKYIKDILSFFRMLLNFAVRKKVLKTVPYFKVHFKGAPSQEKNKALSQDELDTLLAYVKENEAAYYPIIYFAAHTGLRSGELRALTWSDFYLDDDTPFVVVSKSLDIDNTIKETKTGNIRTIPLLQPVYGLIRSLYSGQKADDFVFQSRGKAMASRALYKAVRRSSERANITPISPHSLRHTFATQVANKGGDIFYASLLLGHTDIKTTKSYIKPNLTTLLQKMEDTFQ